MQSDGYSFSGDVVLDSFYLVSVMKTAFKTKNMKSESFGIFTMKILNSKRDLRICIFKEIQHITTRNLVLVGFRVTVVLTGIFV